ncbi:MAG: aldo/keto reductase [Puniceicoccales bacterium]|jgi:aryl-alcohol dehydrogenase-like predicted oxidoreductase|nr:aldo/keto reductase [Puniceicoccales bacterium]
MHLCLGCVALGGYDYGALDEKTCLDTVYAALDNNITHFDTANIYGLGRSEEILGLALQNRNEIIITTKFGVCWDHNQKTTYKDISSKGIRCALEGSLKRLKRDTIDQYLIHWHDGKTNLSEVVETLDKLKDEGKIKAYGCSNFKEEHMSPFVNKFSIIQMPYNMIQKETEPILRFCAKNNYETMAYNILERGLLTGKYDLRTVKFLGTDTRQHSFFFDKNKERFFKTGLDTLRLLAKDKKVTMANLAIAYVTHKSFISCLVVGAKSREQVLENTKALQIRLTKEECLLLDNAFNNTF